MPLVQQLHEKQKQNPDVVVLTLNVDEEAGDARQYAEEHNFQFPVLLAYTYVRRTLGVRGIPQNWVLDRQLVWRAEELGFRGSSDWVERMSGEISSAR